MAGRIRAHDWEATPLGPLAGWPANLRVLVDFMLGSTGVIAIGWGPDFRLIYNDGYARLIGHRHPAVLGTSIYTAFPETRPAFEEHLEALRRGETVELTDQLYAFDRGDGVEDAWFDISYTPVRDDAGRVAGFFCQPIETTTRVLAERRQSESEARQAVLLELSDALRVLTDAATIQGEACRLLCERLGVDRASYVEIDEARGIATVEREHVTGAGVSIVGEHAIARFPWSLEILRRGECHVVVDTQDSSVVPQADRAALAALPIRSCMGAPLIKSDRLVGALYVTASRTRAWIASEVDLLREVGERIWTAIERVRAEAAMRASDEQFRAFVTASSDVVYRMSADWSEMRQLDGRGFLADTKSPREGWVATYILPDDRLTVLAAIEAATRNKQIFELEHRVRRADGSVGWTLSRAVPILTSDGQIAEWLGAARDVTRRKAAEAALRESEERQAFLLTLSDALRPLINPVEAQKAAMMLLAQHLDVMRATYFEVDADQDGFTLAARYEQDPVPFPEHMRLSDFAPDMSEAYRAGRTLAIRDSEVEAPSEVERAAYRAIGVRAGAGVPVLKNGRLLAIVGVHSMVPRDWTRADLQLLEDVADRTWAAVERAHAETALRRREEGHAFLLKLSDALRPLDESLEIQATAARLLGEHLGANQVRYGENVGNAAVTLQGYGSGLPPMVGSFRPLDFGERLVAAYQAGRTAISHDVVSDPSISDAERSVITAAGFRAYVAVPVLKAGVWSATFAVHSIAPRIWAVDEIALVEDVAERTWAAVERARAEAELHRSEERYLGLYNALDQAFCTLKVVFDAQDRATDYRFLEISPSFSAQTGIKDAVGKWMRDIAPAQDQIWFDIYGRVALTGEPARFEAGSGPLGRWWSVYAYRIGDPAAHTIAVLFIDISHRKDTEAALRDSEERFAQFAVSSSDGLWIRDAATLAMEYTSPAIQTIYGIAPDSILGDITRWVSLILPEDRDAAVAHITRARDGASVTHEFRIRRPSDGEERWIKNTDFPLRDAQGRVQRIGGIAEDVTELKVTEAAIVAAEERQRALVEGVAQLVWRALNGGEWTWASPQWTTYTGQSEQDSHDWGWIDPVHPDDRDACHTAWGHAMQTGGFEVEHRIRSAATRDYRWFQTRAMPVRDAAGAIVEWLGTSTDIHELRELQSRQHVLVAELQHRTRNLMGVVRATLEETLRSSTDLDDFSAKFRDRVAALSRVQGMLSRLSTGDRVTFDALIRDEMVAVGALERVVLTGPSGVALRSSTVQTFALALHELATNALKYGALAQTPGRLAVTWQLDPTGPDGKPWLHVDWQESGVVMPPADTAPNGTGQGRRLIERALPYQLGAKTTYVMGPDGVRCSIAVPVSSRTAAEAGHDRPPAS